MFAKKAAYTNRWHIYTAPHTPFIHKGRMMAFDTEKLALEFIEEHAG